jgi:hypothetical protein
MGEKGECRRFVTIGSGTDLTTLIGMVSVSLMARSFGVSLLRRSCRAMTQKILTAALESLFHVSGLDLCLESCLDLVISLYRQRG